MGLTVLEGQDESITVMVGKHGRRQARRFEQ